MGKVIIVDHRQPPASAKIPKILRGGEKVPANPEPEIPTDEVVQLRRQVITHKGEIEEMDRRLRIKTAETRQLKQSLQDARDETHHVRQQAQQPELEGTVPERIEIITMDDIERHDDNVTVQVLANLDGTVGETQLSLSVQQLKILIKRKKQTDEQQTK